ncbi:DUF6970 domain-containing protein [Roseivirga sp.]|uniref:DUF6970 domain-containing protein n=1 Tax=Roseivirga sp. TaxID=1964215 RepID=UPI003B8D331E
MKKYFLSLFIGATLFLTSCGEDTSVAELPSCIQAEIKAAQNIKSSEASVTEYLYNGEKVFGFDPGLVYPDMMTTIVNEDCEVVCQFGGIAGLMTCPDFNENAEVIGIIWQNN